jgi:hypothetical protein
MISEVKTKQKQAGGVAQTVKCQVQSPEFKPSTAKNKTKVTMGLKSI